jgi:hypothetical protein
LSVVSNLDFFDSRTADTEAVAPPTYRVPANSRRRPALLLVGLLGAAASLATGLLLLRPHPRDDRPVVLPDTLVGLSPAETRLQFAQGGDWRTQLAQTFGDHPFDGRAFGGVRPGPLVNLVVVRKDSRDEGDPGLGRPPYSKFGEVSCTHWFQLPDVLGQGESKPYRSDKMLLCWRASETLTVSVLMPLSPPGYEQTAAQAVDEVWALEQ